MSWLGAGSSSGLATAGGGLVGAAGESVKKSSWSDMLGKAAQAVTASQQAESVGQFDKMLTGGTGDAKAQQPKSDKVLGLLGLGFDDTHLKMQQKAENSVPDMLSMFGVR